MKIIDLQALWADPGVPVTLRTTKTSPYGRKVRMALLAQGFANRVSVETADPLDPADTLREQNPLGKMPCLLIGNEAFFDSHVILEMIDALAGGGVLLPAEGLARYRVQTRARLADGITDAALTVTYETRFRTPDQMSERWLDHQRGKIHRGLSAFETEPVDPEELNLISITLAACLGYLDWREPINWRSEFPGIARWLDVFAAAQPAWAATERELA